MAGEDTDAIDDDDAVLRKSLRSRGSEVAVFSTKARSVAERLCSRSYLRRTSLSWVTALERDEEGGI